MDAGIFEAVFARDKIDSHPVVLQGDRFAGWCACVGFEFMSGEPAGEGGVHFDRLRFGRGFPAPTEDGFLAGREMGNELAGQRVRAGDDKKLGVLLGVMAATGVPDFHCEWNEVAGDGDHLLAGDLIDHELVGKVGDDGLAAWPSDCGRGLQFAGFKVDREPCRVGIVGWLDEMPLVVDHQRACFMGGAFREDDPGDRPLFSRRVSRRREFEYHRFAPHSPVVGTVLEGIDCEGESGWFAGVGADVDGVRGPFVFPVGLPEDGFTVEPN